MRISPKIIAPMIFYLGIFDFKCVFLEYLLKGIYDFTMSHSRGHTLLEPYVCMQVPRLLIE